MACRHTIIDAVVFHFRVRDGNGWGHHAVVTRLLSVGFERWLKVKDSVSEDFQALLCFALGLIPKRLLGCRGRFPENWTRSNQELEKRYKHQDNRMISSVKLNRLLDLHPHPINVVVFHDPSGRTHLGMGLALRCFQRLSLPYIAAQRCH
jgi:hypothetical protein